MRAIRALGEPSMILNKWHIPKELAQLLLLGHNSQSAVRRSSLNTGTCVQRAGNRVDIVYDSRLAPRGSGPVFSEEKTNFWKRIDIFVLPTSYREGLPRTILEALASDMPAITTRVGWTPDVIRIFRELMA